MKHWVVAFGLVGLAGGAARAQTVGVEPTQKRDSVLLEFPVQELGAGNTACVGHFSCAHMALGPTAALQRTITLGPGTPGEVTIDTGTGSVTYRIAPGEAANAFLEAVKTMGPESFNGVTTTNTETGAVTYQTAPDGAARAFWEATQPTALKDAK